MRWLVAALVAAVIIGHHALYWVAAAADVAPYVADAATAGIERALLYIVIAALLLAPPAAIALRALLLVIALYGLTESSLVAVCQSIYVMSDINITDGADTCDALTGWPVGTVVALACGALLLLFVAGSARRSRLPGVPYSTDGVFVGFERRGRSAFKVFAALLVHPYAGCVWFREGTGYRFDRARGCLVADPSLRWHDFKLRPFGGDPELLREGLPWSIRHNCVTLR